MRILIFGSSGILGHTLFMFLQNIRSNKVMGLCSENSRGTFFYQKYRKSLVLIDLKDFNLVLKFIEDYKPDVVVNCAVKKIFIENSNLSNILINSVLPQQLSEWALKFSYKFVHISTDSVFGDNFKNKTELDRTLANDLYSASKMLGEPENKNTLVIRTSLIGHSLHYSDGFLNTVLSSKQFTGFSGVVFTGTTALELSSLIYRLVTLSSEVSGVYHIAGQEISKYDLVKLICKVYSLDIEITESKDYKSKRILSSKKLENALNYQPQEWLDLLNNTKSFYYSNSDIYEKKL